jgi:hypothetical protein
MKGCLRCDGRGFLAFEFMELRLDIIPACDLRQQVQHLKRDRNHDRTTTPLRKTQK